MHPYRIEGGVAEVEMRILLRDFVTAEAAREGRIAAQIARMVSAEYPGAKSRWTLCRNTATWRRD